MAVEPAPQPRRKAVSGGVGWRVGAARHAGYQYPVGIELHRKRLFGRETVMLRDDHRTDSGRSKSPTTGITRSFNKWQVGSCTLGQFAALILVFS